MSLITEREPTLLVNDADRRLTYRWVVRRVDEDTDPATLVVNLKIRHHGTSKEYYAELRNETETDRGIGIEKFGWNDPVWHRRQPVARYSRKSLRTFGEQTLAALRQADISGQPLHVDLTDISPAGDSSDAPRQPRSAGPAASRDRTHR
ncbi:hypothetical protein Ga0074812_15235 [Parafrankia irregularis]|uniref:Uncharacterized protein n=1 Tax=Parafrankia irregularis TaxID=795642 RepID=A0A0S4R1G7_9ACTN|nr:MULTISPECIES: hypothetical protein [Parafrankia]MBE3206690.1 hypothetical protein [Parafrankia sp. CH37]CUU61010.1 hypothetical protein Ga0074812_15235 [Parafrankia irregularis]